MALQKYNFGYSKMTSCESELINAILQSLSATQGHLCYLVKHYLSKR